MKIRIEDFNWHEIPLTDDQIRLIINALGYYTPRMDMQELMMSVATIDLLHEHLLETIDPLDEFWERLIR